MNDTDPGSLTRLLFSLCAGYVASSFPPPYSSLCCDSLAAEQLYLLLLFVLFKDNRTNGWVLGFFFVICHVIDLNSLSLLVLVFWCWYPSIAKPSLSRSSSAPNFYSLGPWSGSRNSAPALNFSSESVSYILNLVFIYITIWRMKLGTYCNYWYIIYLPYRGT